VFGADDPTYRGVRIPQLFWKVAAWATPGTSELAAELRAAGYLLDQSPQLNGIDLEEAVAHALATDAPPPLGPFRTYQLPITDVAGLTALDFGALIAADVFAPGPAPVPGPGASGTDAQAPEGVTPGTPAGNPDRSGWLELTDPTQLRF
jgi:endonuclease G